MIQIKETKKYNRQDPNFNSSKLTDADLMKETLLHQAAVNSCVAFFASMLINQGAKHDYTKIGENFNDFKDALLNGFKNDWFKNHCKLERHHLTNNVPDDVNLIDILEMIADCVCAGMARQGTFYPLNLSNELLQKAVSNTSQLLLDNLEVIKDE